MHNRSFVGKCTHSYLPNNRPLINQRFNLPPETGLSKYEQSFIFTTFAISLAVSASIVDESMKIDPGFAPLLLIKKA